jgi:succinoglycan biosynthesis transport protein ExoP
MLKVDKRLISDESNASALSPLDSGPRNFYMRVIRHQMPIMIVFMVLTMALAVLFLFTTVPTYVATASIVIDARKAQLLNPQSAFTQRSQCRHQHGANRDRTSEIR